MVIKDLQEPQELLEPKDLLEPEELRELKDGEEFVDPVVTPVKSGLQEMLD
jgi:hypothetical protein